MSGIFREVVDVTLAEVLFYMMQENQAATQPTDIVIGTVTAVGPLEITMNTAMAPLRAEVLYLTQAVVEKKIPVLTHSHTTGGLEHKHTVSGLSHSHTINGSETGNALGGSYDTSQEMQGASFLSSTELENIFAMENGKELPVKDGYIILNRGLEVGDTVLMLRVLRGQKFIVLSRIFE